MGGPDHRAVLYSSVSSLLAAFSRDCLLSCFNANMPAAENCVSKAVQSRVLQAKAFPTLHISVTELILSLCFVSELNRNRTDPHSSGAMTPLQSRFLQRL
jgi:hypothetical protein